MSYSKIFYALSSQIRRDILQLLKKRDMAAHEIGEHFAITKPSLSHHLSVLKSTGLVSSKRSGQNLIYSINLSVAEEIAAEIYKLLKSKKSK